jgi:glycosyltransferase involved in cell wall biosynthesis
VVVTAELEAQRLCTYGSAPEVATIPLPVPYAAEEGEGSRFRARFGIDPDAPLGVFLSRLDPKKGLERLIDAAPAVAAQVDGFRMAIVGDALEPAYERGLRERATALAQDQAVVWTGALSGQDKWDALAAADVFLLPSDNENFGIVVVEAALAGAPIVLSDEVYIAREVAAVGEATICGPDVPSVIEAIVSVLRDPDSRDRAERARADVRAHFSPERSTALTQALYASVLGAQDTR